jgi:hypothetical protein
MDKFPVETAIYRVSLTCQFFRRDLSRLYKELHNSVIANLDKSGQNEPIVSFSKADFIKRCRKYHNLGK